MICDRCHRRIERSDNPDQALCDACLKHLRHGGGWSLGSLPGPRPAPSCPRELLPMRAGILFGSVPLYPTESDFHLASSAVASEPDEAAAFWRIEAIRERRDRPGIAFDEATLGRIAERAEARFAVRYEDEQARMDRWARGTAASSPQSVRGTEA